MTRLLLTIVALPYLLARGAIRIVADYVADVLRPVESAHPVPDPLDDPQAPVYRHAIHYRSHGSDIGRCGNIGGAFALNRGVLLQAALAGAACPTCLESTERDHAS